MKRVMLVVAYDGTRYCGWQLQKNGIAIEEVLNKALSELLREPVTVIGASRTDSGVHALGNVAVFDTDNRMPAGKICFALNQRLPEDIKIQWSEEVDADFHPRKRNCMKTYEYKILNCKIDMPVNRLYTHFCYIPLDVELMRAAAGYLVGEHDFKSFCTTRTRAEETVRTIYSLDVEKVGDVITLRISGSGFLYNMVRIIAGTLMKVGMKAYPPEHVEEIIAARDRNTAGPKAVAKGLTLISLEYEKELKPVISAQNNFWSYRLIQKEIVPRKKAYLCIERCAADDFDRLMQRTIHQAVRNGARQVFVCNRQNQGFIEEKTYGFYQVSYVYDIVRLRISTTDPTFPEQHNAKEQKAAGINLRKALTSDAEAFLAAYKMTFDSLQNAETFEAEDFLKYIGTENQNIFLLQDEAQRTIGFAGVSMVGDVLTLDMLGICPVFQRNGYGTWLLDKIRKLAVAANCHFMELDVCTANTSAYSLYKKHGFEETGKLSRWYRTEDNRPD